MSKNKIQIGLRSVREINFKFSPENIEKDFDPSQLRLGFDNSLENLDGEKGCITVDFGVKYFYRDEEILQCIYGFNFVVENLAKYVKLEEDMSVKVNVIMPRLLNTALETMRGIILARTSGTPLFDCPLPIIDVEQE